MRGAIFADFGRIDETLHLPVPEKVIFPENWLSYLSPCPANKKIRNQFREWGRILGPFEDLLREIVWEVF